MGWPAPMRRAGRREGSLDRAAPLLVLFPENLSDPEGRESVIMSGKGRSASIHGFVLAAALLGAAGSPAAAVSNCAPDGVQSSGAVYRICMPEPTRWNRDLVVWAHGYVSVERPIGIPDDQLCLTDTFCLPTVINLLGFGFATTSYSANGLAALQGVADVSDLVDLFAATHGPPRRVYLVGASEGGLVTALAVEQRPDLFSGGLAACGPIGDFNFQVSYFGDFRVLFDYFFPGLLSGTPTDVPDELMESFDAIYEETIHPVVFDPANQQDLADFLKTGRVPFLPGDLPSMERSVLDGLWYNVFATEDAFAKLGGQPFGNLGKVYRGSSDDTALNAQVQRIGADPAALEEIAARYQTTGRLSRPLVTLHTTMDQQVPYGHEPRYRRKVVEAGSGALHVNIPVLRYGHCNFTALEALFGFAVVVGMVSQRPLEGVEAVLGDEADRASFDRLSASFGVPARVPGGPGRSAPAPLRRTE